MESGTLRAWSGYKVPGSLDVPVAIHPILLEHAAGPGPFGAKGVAEAGVVGVAPAVCNAIRHATDASVSQIPATGERVPRALLAHEEARRSTSDPGASDGEGLC